MSRNIIHRAVSRAVLKLANAIPDDKLYLKIKYWGMMGKKLDLKHPKTFNEKLQWLKLYNRKEQYTTMVDKYAVKDYVAEKIGAEYVIPTLGVWERFEDIDFDALPDRFVLKCTHDSGGLVICRDKSKLDLAAARQKIEKSLRTDYFMTVREWPYKNVPRRIIAEQYMEDHLCGELRDYKFFCFDGVAESVMVCTERETGEPKFYFFDKSWTLKRYNLRGKAAPEGFTLEKPDRIDEMFALAEKLSAGIPFLRVDLYSIDGVPYFGETTFFPDSGFDANLLAETDAYWGSLLKLPEPTTSKR